MTSYMNQVNGVSVQKKDGDSCTLFQMDTASMSRVVKIDEELWANETFILVEKPNVA